MYRRIFAVAVATLAVSALSWAGIQGDKVTVASMPPAVIKTVPKAGSTDVDASKIKSIKVTFSKKMIDGNWSWVQISGESYPTVTGEPRFDKKKRTCTLPVKLEPGTGYAIWINTDKYTSFRDTDGRPAIPYLLVFETKAQAGTQALH
jgi:RNA polymerase sigma-70 factor (ECF subfamily)